MRLVISLLAVCAALVCLASVSSSTNSRLRSCLYGCKRCTWRRGACYCRKSCIRNYLIKTYPAENPIVCFYRRWCAHYLCCGAYYQFHRCKRECYNDYYNRFTTTLAPMITTTAEATTSSGDGILEITTTGATATTPSTVVSIVTDVTTSAPTTTEATTTEATTTEATTTEATTTEATTTEATTTEATTTEATTTEATTTDAMTTTEMIAVAAENK